MNEDFLPFTRPSIDEATIAAVGEVLRSGWITSGPKVLEFEARLSGYCGGRPVRALASATGALEIARQAVHAAAPVLVLRVGIGQQDEHVAQGAVDVLAEGGAELQHGDAGIGFHLAQLDLRDFLHLVAQSLAHAPFSGCLGLRRSNPS